MIKKTTKLLLISTVNISSHTESEPRCLHNVGFIVLCSGQTEKAILLGKRLTRLYIALVNIGAVVQTSAALFLRLENA